jgi:hypothetical protein
MASAQLCSSHGGGDLECGLLTPYYMVDDYQRFEETCCVHLQGKSDLENLYTEDEGSMFV